MLFRWLYSRRVDSKESKLRESAWKGHVCAHFSEGGTPVPFSIVVYRWTSKLKLIVPSILKLTKSKQRVSKTSGGMISSTCASQKCVQLTLLGHSLEGRYWQFHSPLLQPATGHASLLWSSSTQTGVQWPPRSLQPVSMLAQGADKKRWWFWHFSFWTLENSCRDCRGGGDPAFLPSPAILPHAEGERRHFNSSRCWRDTAEGEDKGYSWSRPLQSHPNPSLLHTHAVLKVKYIKMYHNGNKVCVIVCFVFV